MISQRSNSKIKKNMDLGKEGMVDNVESHRRIRKDTDGKSLIALEN